MGTIIGAILIACALGLSISGLIFYSHVSNNLVNLNSEHGIVQLTNENNEIDYPQTYYALGIDESDKYKIEYAVKPETINKGYYKINGSFVNETGKHFAAIKLNFSLLDKNKSKVGDIYAECDGLNPKQAWSFTAMNTAPLEIDEKVTEVVLDDIRITY